jgi:hypothetical protein
VAPPQSTAASASDRRTPRQAYGEVDPELVPAPLFANRQPERAARRDLTIQGSNPSPGVRRDPVAVEGYPPNPSIEHGRLPARASSHPPAAIRGPVAVERYRPNPMFANQRRAAEEASKNPGTRKSRNSTRILCNLFKRRSPSPDFVSRDAARVEQGRGSSWRS